LPSFSNTANRKHAIQEKVYAECSYEEHILLVFGLQCDDLPMGTGKRLDIGEGGWADADSA
jgi:hypothetical protein